MAQQERQRVAALSAYRKGQLAAAFDGAATAANKASVPQAVVRVHTPQSGFDWGDAGLGAAGGLVISLLVLGGDSSSCSVAAPRPVTRRHWPSVAAQQVALRYASTAGRLERPAPPAGAASSTQPRTATARSASGRHQGARPATAPRREDLQRRGVEPKCNQGGPQDNASVLPRLPATPATAHTTPAWRGIVDPMCTQTKTSNA